MQENPGNEEENSGIRQLLGVRVNFPKLSRLRARGRAVSSRAIASTTELVPRAALCLGGGTGTDGRRGQGGKQTTDKWAIRVQLTKPVTWVPLIWGVACGAAAAGTP